MYCAWLHTLPMSQTFGSLETQLGSSGWVETAAGGACEDISFISVNTWDSAWDVAVIFGPFLICFYLLTTLTVFEMITVFSIVFPWTDIMFGSVFLMLEVSKKTS